MFETAVRPKVSKLFLKKIRISIFSYSLARKLLIRTKTVCKFSLDTEIWVLRTRKPESHGSVRCAKLGSNTRRRWELKHDRDTRRHSRTHISTTHVAALLISSKALADSLADPIALTNDARYIACQPAMPSLVTQTEKSLQTTHDALTMRSFLRLVIPSRGTDWQLQFQLSDGQKRRLRESSAYDVRAIPS